MGCYDNIKGDRHDPNPTPWQPRNFHQDTKEGEGGGPVSGYLDNVIVSLKIIKMMVIHCVFVYF